MSFDDTKENDLSLVGKALEDDDRRDRQRRSVLWPAVLHVANHQFNCQIRNFSMSGLKLKFNLPLKEGTVIKLEIPRRNVVLRAEIAWQADELLGIRFLEKTEVIQETFGERAAVMGIGISDLLGALDQASA